MAMLGAVSRLLPRQTAPKSCTTRLTSDRDADVSGHDQISPTTMQDREPTDGERMVLPEFATLTVSRTLPSPSGMSKSKLLAGISHYTTHPYDNQCANGFPIVPLSPFLKERLFGLSNPQGNHGESIKEAHFHLDNLPVSSKTPRTELHRLFTKITLLILSLLFRQ